MVSILDFYAGDPGSFQVVEILFCFVEFFFFFFFFTF